MRRGARRRAWSGSGGRPASTAGPCPARFLRFGFVRHAKLVPDVSNARQALRDVLRQPLHVPLGHVPAQHDLASPADDLDLAGVDFVVVLERLAHVLEDALVGAAVALRALAREAAGEAPHLVPAGTAVGVDAEA